MAVRKYELRIQGFVIRILVGSHSLLEEVISSLYNFMDVAHMRELENSSEQQRPARDGNQHVP